MDSSNSSPWIPEDLAPDPGVTYNPSPTVAWATVLPTEPAIPLGSPSGHTAPTSVRERSTTPSKSRRAEPEDVTFPLQERIARGGFGDVWSGIQPSLDRAVAIKRPREDRMAELNAEDRLALLEVFRQEALTSARLEHPNIMPVYQLGTDTKGWPMLAMKLVRGRPWSELIREDLQLPVDELMSRHLPILIDVAQAVAYAHSQSVLHRDLKPQQVMVGEFGEVLLMDWGLALPFGDAGAILPTVEADISEASGSATSVTAARALAGTPAFMAPEQTRGEPTELGPWTDLYLLGGILYYLLTGTPTHKASGGAAAFVKASAGKIEPPEERSPGRRVPDELWQLTQGILQAEPESRRPTAVSGLIAALEDYLSGASRKRRSRELIAEIEQRSTTAGDYSELGHQLSVLQEAQTLWPQNYRASELRQQVLKRYAEAALAQKDLALARLQAGQLTPGTQRSEMLERTERALLRRQRRARQRRLSLTALAVLATLLIGGTFWVAHDQRRAAERLAAERDAARLARSDATSLMTFMLEDLWQSLMSIERVDLLAPIAQRAGSYYSDRDPDSLSSVEVTNRGATFATLGDTLRFQGDIQGAITAFRKAVDVFRSLIEEEPADRDLLLRYLEALERLGQTQSDLGDKSAALVTLGEHRRRCEAAATRWPNDPEIEIALLSGIDSAGIVHYDLGEVERAGEAFRQALERAETAQRRGHPPAVDHLASSIEMRLAVTQMETGQLQAALRSIERSIATARATEQRDGSQSSAWDGVSQSIYAAILFDLGRRDEAVAVLQGALPEARRLVAEDPANAERRYGLAQLEIELAKLESRRGNPSEAKRSWQRVVDTVEPLRETTDHAYLLDSLVRALLHLGRVNEARPVAEALLAKAWSHQDFRELCRRHGIELLVEPSSLGNVSEAGASPSDTPGL